MQYLISSKLDTQFNHKIYEFLFVLGPRVGITAAVKSRVRYCPHRLMEGPDMRAQKCSRVSGHGVSVTEVHVTCKYHQKG